MTYLSQGVTVSLWRNLEICVCDMLEDILSSGTSFLYALLTLQKNVASSFFPRRFRLLHYLAFISRSTETEESRNSTQMGNILLFGGGAIGGVYISKFLQAGCTVTAVPRSNYTHVKTNGFHMDSIRFDCVDFHPTNVVKDIHEAAQYGPYDFVVICSKTFPGSKPSLADQIRPAITPQTAIVLIQNGIDIESDVSEAFPDNPLLSTVVYVPSTQTSPGVIDYGYTQNDMLNLLEIGTYPSAAPPPHKAAATHLASLVTSGGGIAQVFDDVQTQRWSKLVVNASWNPITALSLSTHSDFIRSSPYAKALVRNVMYEVVSIAQALNIKGITRELAEEHLARQAKGQSVRRRACWWTCRRAGRSKWRQLWGMR
jgi:2-dehydropantoate 2-reductase